MTARRAGPGGPQPTDPPWARLLFLLVQGRDGEWWRGFVLVALVGLLLVGVLGTLIIASWASGALGIGSAASALGVIWYYTRHLRKPSVNERNKPRELRG